MIDSCILPIISTNFYEQLKKKNDHMLNQIFKVRKSKVFTTLMFILKVGRLGRSLVIQLSQTKKVSSKYCSTCVQKLMILNS